MNRQGWRRWRPTKAEVAVVVAAIVVGSVVGLLTRPDRSIRRTEVLERAVTTTVPVTGTRPIGTTITTESSSITTDPSRPPSRPMVTTSTTSPTTTTTTTTATGPDAPVAGGTGSMPPGPAGPEMPVLGLLDVEVEVEAVGVGAGGSLERVAVAGSAGCLSRSWAGGCRR